MTLSHYDPATRKLHIRPDSSLYVRMHEQAHKIQHESNCWPWFFWIRFNGIRVLGYFANAWIEFDAVLRARRAMKAAGAWNAAASNEASTKFMSYIKGRGLT